MPVLIMHLLLVRFLESLAVPAVPAVGTEGSEEALLSLAPTVSPRVRWKAVCARAVGSSGGAGGNAAPLPLAGPTLWPGARCFPGAPQGLAVLKAVALSPPLCSGACVPHAWLDHAAARSPSWTFLMETSPLLTYLLAHPVSPHTGSGGGTGIAMAMAIAIQPAGMTGRSGDWLCLREGGGMVTSKRSY